MGCYLVRIPQAKLGAQGFEHMIPSTSTELAYLILMVEFALVALGMGIALMRARQAPPSQTAPTAAVSGPTTLDARRAALLGVLHDNYQLSTEEGAEVLRDLVEREHAFYTALLAVHLKRGNQPLEDVPRDVVRTVAPWLRIPSLVGDANAVDIATIAAAQHAQSADMLDELMLDYRATFEPVDVDAMASAMPTTMAADEHDLSNLDENLEAPVIATMTASPPSFDSTDIIALDGDIAPHSRASADQVTPSDLDLLMENLDSDFPQQSAAA